MSKLLQLFVFLALCQIVNSLFFPTVTPSCGCGCGGRRKREIGFVKGSHHLLMDEINGQCNSQEFAEVILKHMSLPSLKNSRDAIYKELDAAYPDSMLTVFCLRNATASYQADARRYCMESGEDGRHCYVFEF